jgi:MFS family permease
MERATGREPGQNPEAAAPSDHPYGIAALLRNRSFRFLWLAGSLSGTIRWLETLAIAVFILEQTNSAFMVALTLFFRMFPMFLFGAFTGVIADRINRKKLMVGGMFILAVNSSVMGVLAITGAIEVWHVMVGIFLSGTVWSSEFPVRRTMMGEVVGMERVNIAMGVDAATVNFTRMVGPFFGGVLFELMDLQGVYFVGTGFYLLAFLSALTVSYTPTRLASTDLGFFKTMTGGLSYIRSRRPIVGILVVTIMVNIWGFPYTSMVAVIGKEDLHLNAILIGVLASSEGLGALIASLLIATRARLHQYTRIYIYGSFIFLVTVLLFSLSPWFALSLPLIFVGGLGLAGFATMQSTLMMISAPPELRSRVMGVLSVSIGTGPLGVLHLGGLASWLGAATAVSIIGIEGLIALTIAVLIWPELRRATDIRPSADS